MAKITSPVEGYKGRIAGVEFRDGKADTTDPGALAYFRRKGYKVGNSSGEVSEQTRLLTEAPEPADPLAGDQQVGTSVRDAAVDPRPSDYLPPINAGKANPHGPLVVAPGIHAEGERVVRPGAVHVADPKQQESDETEHARALLVDRKDADQVAAVPADADKGPLGLSDPGSVEVGEQTDSGNTAELDQPKKAAAKKTRRS